MKFPAIVLALTALSYADKASESPAALAAAAPAATAAPPANVAGSQGVPRIAAGPQGAVFAGQAGREGGSRAVQDSSRGRSGAIDLGAVAVDGAPVPAGLRANGGQFVPMPGIAYPQPALLQDTPSSLQQASPSLQEAAPSLQQASQLPQLAQLPPLPQARPSAQRQAPALKSAPPSAEGLIPGDVFGLITLSDDKGVNGETVVIYQDGTLGVNEPNSPGYLFEATLMPEYELLIVPEPLATVKLNDQKVLFVNDSLYNPAPIFSSQQWTLRMRGAHAVVCPSWNSVLVHVADNEAAPCSDAVNVSLHIVPITV